MSRFWNKNTQVTGMYVLVGSVLLNYTTKERKTYFVIIIMVYYYLISEQKHD